MRKELEFKDIKQLSEKANHKDDLVVFALGNEYKCRIKKYEDILPDTKYYFVVSSSRDRFKEQKKVLSIICITGFEELALVNPTMIYFFSSFIIENFEKEIYAAGGTNFLSWFMMNLGADLADKYWRSMENENSFENQDEYEESDEEIDEEFRISDKDLAKGILSLMEKLAKMIDEKSPQEK